MKYIAAIILSSLIAFQVNAGPMHGGHADRMLDKMTEKLELTDGQRAQVEQIFEQQRPKMEAIHEQMKALREETDTQIKGVLTPEQLTQYEKMQKKRQEKMEKFHKKHSRDE